MIITTPATIICQCSRTKTIPYHGQYPQQVVGLGGQPVGYDRLAGTEEAKELRTYAVSPATIATVEIVIAHCQPTYLCFSNQFMFITSYLLFNIHFSINDYDDYFTVEGDTIEDIKISADRETERRGLTMENNHFWSEELK